MGNIIYLGVLIFLWVVLQYIIYIYIYYRYEICKEQKHIVIYRNSKFICYIVALIISICAITIFFKKYNSITMFKEIIFLRSIDAGKVILLFSINLIILVMLFVAESMLYGKQKLNIKKIVKIEFEKKM